MYRAFAFAASMLASCAYSQTATAQARPGTPPSEIEYISTDLSTVAVFSPRGARFGSFLARSEVAWPSSPTRFFDVKPGIRCVSIGKPGNTVEYAIKERASLGDAYKCVDSLFRVTRCFLGCRSSIVEVRTPIRAANRRGTFKSYLYVDSCRGVLVISQLMDLSKGIPPSAPWLRGSVGILADKASPDCKYTL